MNPIILTQLKDSWFKKQNELIQKRRPRRYLHFDKPIPSLTRQIWNEITDIKLIETHSFFPLLKNPKSSRVYKKDPETKTKTIEWKERPISYASHYDSLIYSWYTHQLEFFYEQRLEQAGLSENVIAYRKLGKKSNIDFSLEVFEFVKKLPQCITLSLDIKKFYDTLDFIELKKAWKANLNLNDLPKDHYAVFKSITKFAYIRAREIMRLKKISFEKNPKSKFILNTKVLEELRNNRKVKQNKLVGIPQGTPISCALSNLYMFNFDKAVSEKVNNLGGLYRRYSDDILVVCPDKNGLEDLEIFIKEKIDSLKLKIQETKTEKRYFSHRTTGIVCLDEKGNSSRLQYLGVILDDSGMSLRHKGYAKFERKMRNAIKRKIVESQENKTPFFKRKIYESYSPLGKQNYIRYARAASEKLSSSVVKKQISFHRIMKKISKKIKKEKQKLIE